MTKAVAVRGAHPYAVKRPKNTLIKNSNPVSVIHIYDRRIPFYQDVKVLTIALFCAKYISVNKEGFAMSDVKKVSLCRAGNDACPAYCDGLCKYDGDMCKNKLSVRWPDAQIAKFQSRVRAIDADNAAKLKVINEGLDCLIARLDMMIGYNSFYAR